VDINIISPAEAARIYKKITGAQRSPQCVEADVHNFPHLGCFDYTGRADPKLKGVNRHAWEYFVGTRLLTRGRRRIFGDTDDGDLWT